jgi:hypothetical protein
MDANAPRSVVTRAIGAAMLDIDTYEEVEADTTATAQAGMVVLAVAVASALGASGEGSPGMVAGVLNAFAGWLIWAGVTNLVGTRLLGGTADWGELLRTLGFAQAPGVLLILGIVPLLGGVIQLGVGIWILVAGVIAIRQALDVSTGRAIAAALISMVFVVAAAVAVGIVLGTAVGVASLFTG